MYLIIDESNNMQEVCSLTDAVKFILKELMGDSLKSFGVRKFKYDNNGNKVYYREIRYFDYEELYPLVIAIK